MEKLIIIRGPSGAGKSSIAKTIIELSDRPSALEARDHYRFMFSNPWDDNKAAAEKKMIQNNILTALEHGYDTIVEGIFNVKTHSPMFERIFQQHPDENYVFYLDVPFEETLRRHESRPQREEFGKKEMEEWWSYASPLGHPNEVIIPESSTMEETLRTIGRIAGLNLQNQRK